MNTSNTLSQIVDETKGKSAKMFCNSRLKECSKSLTAFTDRIYNKTWDEEDNSRAKQLLDATKEIGPFGYFILTKFMGYKII